MMSLTVSAILPARPVHSDGMRVEKTPFFNALKILSNSFASSSSLSSAVISMECPIAVLGIPSGAKNSALDPARVMNSKGPPAIFAGSSLHGFFQVLRQHIRRHRFAVQITLVFIAAEAAQNSQLLIVFDALGHHPQSERARHVDDRRDDRDFAEMLAQIAH